MQFASNLSLQGTNTHTHTNFWCICILLEAHKCYANKTNRTETYQQDICHIYISKDDDNDAVEVDDNI